MTTLTGVAESEIIGKGNYEYAKPFYHKARPTLISLLFESADGILSTYDNVKQENGQLIAEVFFPELNQGKGAYLWVIISPLFDPAGNIVGAIESIRDISDRKKAELELRLEKEKAEKYLDIANTIILSLDSQGIVRLINRKGSEILGMPEAEIIGKSWIDSFIPEQDRDVIKDHLNSFIQSGIDEVEFREYRIRRLDGEERVISWYRSPIYGDDGSIIGLLASGQDITHEKELEMKQVVSMNQIQANLAQLSILNDGIRNPLTIILTMVEEFEPSAETDVITQQVHRIDQIIHELDSKWVESDKVLNYLRKYHNFKLYKEPGKD